MWLQSSLPLKVTQAVIIIIIIVIVVVIIIIELETWI